MGIWTLSVTWCMLTVFCKAVYSVLYEAAWWLSASYRWCLCSLWFFFSVMFFFWKLEPRSWRGALYAMLNNINKTDHHDITEILLKVVLSTINPTLQMANMDTVLLSKKIHSFPLSGKHIIMLIKILSWI
jgi:hypothetical protein